MAQAAPGGLTAPPPGKYELDVAHSAVEFVGRHILSKVRGRFTEFSSTIELAEKPEDSNVEVEIRTASVQTNLEPRDADLRGENFMDIDKFPAITFRSTGVRLTGGAAFELDGELTIKDITRPVTLAGEYLGTSQDPYGNTVFAASAKTTIDREDWDMTWNMVIETGGLLVGKKVDLEIEVEAKKVG